MTLDEFAQSDAIARHVEEFKQFLADGKLTDYDSRDMPEELRWLDFICWLVGREKVSVGSIVGLANDISSKVALILSSCADTKH